jgi:sugar-specific transcriptional regulator TrmB
MEPEYEHYEELGLTKNEGKAYSALVQFGKLSAGQVSAKANVPYGKVYNILNSLINKGLARIIPEKTKQFVPCDPESLIKFIEKKEKKLEKAKEKAKELKKFYGEEKNPVTMDFGVSGFHRLVKEIDTFHKYDYTIKWSSELRPEWIRSTEKGHKLKADIKTLSRYDEETKKKVDEWLKVQPNIRKFDNEGVAIAIADDKQVLISLIKSNVTLLINNPEFTKIMRQLFLEAYKNAEEIKPIKKSGKKVKK